MWAREAWYICVGAVLLREALFRFVWNLFFSIIGRNIFTIKVIIWRKIYAIIADYGKSIWPNFVSSLYQWSHTTGQHILKVYVLLIAKMIHCGKEKSREKYPKRCPFLPTMCWILHRYHPTMHNCDAIWENPPHVAQGSFKCRNKQNNLKIVVFLYLLLTLILWM